MNSQRIYYQPLEYIEERVDELIESVMRPQYLPQKIRSNLKSEDRTLFIDMLLGWSLDRAANDYNENSRKYTRAMSQVALTLEYLGGATKDQCIEFAHSHGLRLTNEMLPVTAVHHGAHAVRDYFANNEAFPARTGRDRHEFFDASTEGFGNIGEVVRRLYEEDRIQSGEAQAILLLLGQAKSSAPVPVQQHVLRHYRPFLRGLLSRTIVRQPHVRDAIADRTFEEGIKYLKYILDYGKTDSIRQLATQSELSDIEEAHYHITSHIGYVIDKMYPAKNGG
ncbi:MAG: hypothetical protein ACSLEY_03380 [Candidatus Saccharimonadales bacterium]